FERLCLEQIERRPSSELQCTEPLPRIDEPAGIRTIELARQVGEDDDRKLEALGSMNGHHADNVTTLFEDRSFRSLRHFRRLAQFGDETRERDAAVQLVLACQLGDMHHVGERLLAALPQDQADVRARAIQKLSDRLTYRPIVAAAVEVLEETQRIGNRTKM